MAWITTILWTNLLRDSRPIINTNFSNLNDELALNKWGPEWYWINYKIVPSINWWDLTISMKTLAWTDASSLNPISIRIGDTVRMLTSSLSVTAAAWTNYLNMWSLQLVDNIVNLFVYLVRESDWIRLLLSRKPLYRTYWELIWLNNTDEKWSINTLLTSDSTAVMENIWRISLILDAWNNWVTPVWWFNVYNMRTIDGDWDYTPQYIPSGSMTYTGVTTSVAKYKIIGNIAHVLITSTGTIGWTPGNTLEFSRPITPANTAFFWTTGSCIVVDNSISKSWLLFYDTWDTAFVVRKYDSSNWVAGTVYFSCQITYFI